MGFVFGGVSGLSNRVVTFGNGWPKKVEILRVDRQFALAALLMCCLLSSCVWTSADATLAVNAIAIRGCLIQ